MPIKHNREVGDIRTWFIGRITDYERGYRENGGDGYDTTILRESVTIVPFAHQPGPTLSEGDNNYLVVPRGYKRERYGEMVLAKIVHCDPSGDVFWKEVTEPE